MSESKKTFVITRFDPDKDEVPKTQEYEIPVEEDWKVLDAINFIKDEVDPTISHRWSCRMAVCGSCGMMVDGEPKLTCKTALSDYGERVSIEPLANFPIVRDLVTELEGFMEKFKAVKPWVIRAKEEAGASSPPLSDPPLSNKGTFVQSPEELAEFKQFSLCINCMLCYAACPVVANEAEFLGPAAIALGHRYNLDTRDQGQDERNEIFRGEGTVFSCSFANECSEVCPKNVDPAAAVNQAKFGAVIDWATKLVLPRASSRGSSALSSSKGDE
jgi:fumarate reductase iron-sulfur subunit